MVRITGKQGSEAGIKDCVAHRCESHKHIDAVFQMHVEGPLENRAECAYCVADTVIKQLVAETIFPIVAAFEAAEGQLRLLGVDKGGKPGALFRLLMALTEKAGEDDFSITAQQVIHDTLLAKGPDAPQ
jgi:hypothetical protein